MLDHILPSKPYALSCFAFLYGKVPFSYHYLLLKLHFLQVTLFYRSLVLPLSSQTITFAFRYLLLSLPSVSVTFSYHYLLLLLPSLKVASLEATLSYRYDILLALALPPSTVIFPYCYLSIVASLTITFSDCYLLLPLPSLPLPDLTLFYF